MSVESGYQSGWVKTHQEKPQIWCYEQGSSSPIMVNDSYFFGKMGLTVTCLSHVTPPKVLGATLF